MHPDWARSLRDQCAAAGGPFFFKQWGEWIPCHAEGELAGTFLSRRSDGSNRLASNDKQLRLMVGVEFRRVGKADAGRLLDGVVPTGELGRASCRERVFTYVYTSVFAVSLKKK